MFQSDEKKLSPSTSTDLTKKLGDCVASAKEIAEWMMEQISDDMYLYQETVAYEIASRFGDNFTYYNHNGNLAIGQCVLREFRKLTEDTIVWNKGEKAWRWRVGDDSQGRLQRGSCDK
jgi:hypothetical protein